MSSDDKTIIEAAFIERVERFGGSPDYVEALQGKPERALHRSLLERARFFLSILLELLIDASYLGLVYLWVSLIHQMTKGFSLISGFESALLTILTLVLQIFPTVLVVWYVLIDLIGAVRRIWESRRWSSDT